MIKSSFGIVLFLFRAIGPPKWGKEFFVFFLVISVAGPYRFVLENQTLTKGLSKAGVHLPYKSRMLLN